MSKEFSPDSYVYCNKIDSGKSFKIISRIGEKELVIQVGCGPHGPKTRIVHVDEHSVSSAATHVGAMQTEGFRPGTRSAGKRRR